MICTTKLCLSDYGGAGRVSLCRQFRGTPRKRQHFRIRRPQQRAKSHGGAVEQNDDVAAAAVGQLSGKAAYEIAAVFLSHFFQSDIAGG